mmetsp:Transcript_10640/g.19288  ORF Transcript_10640/g.19288 Transcript_10640/m.19288 type:complete len:258 (+) Transcript_10640:872-1645(+)
MSCIFSTSPEANVSAAGFVQVDTASSIDPRIASRPDGFDALFSVLAIAVVSSMAPHSFFKNDTTFGLSRPAFSKSAGDPPIAVLMAPIKSGSDAASIMSAMAAGLFCSFFNTSSGRIGSIAAEAAPFTGADVASIDALVISTADSASFSPRTMSNIRLLPTFDVITKIVFLKFTVRPLPSVSMPSSIICKRILSTSPCAFSSSSNNTTECGERRTASVNCPPSSYPMYPGGGPVSRLTLCFSIYSDMSMRIMSFSDP